MLKTIAAAALGCGMLLSSAVCAYTPESGFWWNPNAPGTGLQIEIQDNFIAITAYSYDLDGNQLWTTAQGFLDDNASFHSTNDPDDGTWLNTFTDGQCLGCPFTGGPIAHAGSAGPIDLVFDPDDPTRATLTWGGRTQPIERLQFYLHRFSDGNVPIQVTKMLGEWHTLEDFSDITNYTGYPYYGEVLAFESYDYSNGDDAWLFEGCRTDDSLGGGCTEVVNGLYYHDAAGLYDPQTGRQLIVITDTRNNVGQYVNCVLYDVQVGTDYFSGGLDYEHDGASGGFAIYPCGQNPFDYDFHPVRGYRSASRTFVQEGYGPSKRQSAGRAPSAISDIIKPVPRAKSAARPAHAEATLAKLQVLMKRLNTPHKHVIEPSSVETAVSAD